MFFFYFKRYIGIISLSIVDFCLCLLVSPLQIIRETISVDENKSLDPKLCSAITFVSSWACLSSIFSLTLISIERLLVFKNNRHLEKRKFLLFILIAHFISFVFALINSFMNRLGSSLIFLRCSNKTNLSLLEFNLNYFLVFQIGFKIFFISVGFVCLSLTTYCYYVIYKIIRTKQLLRLKLNGLIAIMSKNSLNQIDNNENDGSNQSLPNRKPSKPTMPSRKLSMSVPNMTTMTKLAQNEANLFLREESSIIKLKTFKCSSYHLDQDESNLNKVTIISLNKDLQEIKSTKNMRLNIKKSGTISMEDKAIRKTIIPIVVFYLFWLPYACVQICTLISDSYYFEIANLMSISIGFCHSSINPIIYCCTNMEIQKAMKNKLKKLFLQNSAFVYLVDKLF